MLLLMFVDVLKGKPTPLTEHEYDSGSSSENEPEIDEHTVKLGDLQDLYAKQRDTDSTDTESDQSEDEDNTAELTNLTTLYQNQQDTAHEEVADDIDMDLDEPEVTVETPAVAEVTVEKPAVAEATPEKTEESEGEDETVNMGSLEDLFTEPLEDVDESSEDVDPEEEGDGAEGLARAHGRLAQQHVPG